MASVVSRTEETAEDTLKYRIATALGNMKNHTNGGHGMAKPLLIDNAPYSAALLLSQMLGVPHAQTEKSGHPAGLEQR